MTDSLNLRTRWVALAVAVGLVFSVISVANSTAEAAKPLHDRNFLVNSLRVESDGPGSCTAKLKFEGLKGGKKINVEFRLLKDTGADGTFDHTPRETHLPGSLQVVTVARGRSFVVDGHVIGTNGYAEYTFPSPYGAWGNGRYHVQARIYDENSKGVKTFYTDFGLGTPSEFGGTDVVYTNWEKGVFAATLCN